MTDDITVQSDVNGKLAHTNDNNVTPVETIQFKEPFLARWLIRHSLMFTIRRKTPAPKKRE